MKILHIDPDDIDNPLSGGGPLRTYQIYRRLAQRHQVTVLTPTFAGSTPEIERDGVRFVRLGKKVGDHGSSHHITFFFSLPGALRRFEYDLLVEDFMPPVSATLTPLFNRKPLIASVQWFFAKTLQKQYKLPFALGERYGIRLYRDFIVLSEAMKREIQRLHSHARCTVIPEGVEDRLFDAIPTYGDFILYLGRVDLAQKGVDLLLRAYASVPTSERLRLVLAGHGFEWPAVQALISELGLGDWVSVLGRVSRLEGEKLLAACRFCCVSSRDETFGMVILEACATGKPVVLFDRAPMNEVAAPGACEFARAFDTSDFAQKMLVLLRIGDFELERRGRACRDWARAFSWDGIARRQEAVYESVMERERAKVQR